MTDYIQKALDVDYEGYLDFLIKQVDDEIDSKKIPLREAAENVISEAFYQLRGEKYAMNNLFLKANEVLDPPCEDDDELENHTIDRVVEGIRRNELYMAQKTGTRPRSDRT